MESEPNVVSSDWRSTLAQRARKPTASIEGLSVVTASCSPESRGVIVTCCASISAQAQPATSTGSSTVAVVCPRAVYFATVTDAGVAPIGSLKLELTASSPSSVASISSCDWLGDASSSTFLAGTVRGTVSAFRVPPSPGIVAEPVAVFGGLQQRQASPSPVRSVSGCPYDASAFATTEGDSFSVWSTESPDPRKPAVTRKAVLGAGVAVTRFSWSPHAEAIGALAAGPTGSLALVDIRLDKPVVARKDAAHGGLPVTAIAWSPYVTNWLATGGADCAVNIWDLRWAAMPVATLAHHFAPVSSVAWDSRHCEILAAGSSDATLSCSSLALGSGAGASLWRHQAPAAVLHAGFVPTRARQSCCFAVTDDGGISVAAMDDAFFVSVLESGQTPPAAEEARAREVEQQVYLRQFKKAFVGAHKLARELETLDRPEEALSVLMYCYQKKPPEATDFKSAETRAPSTETFAEDVRGFASHIPPGYHERFPTQIDADLSIEIEQMKLALELQTALKRGQVSVSIARHRDVCDALRREKSKIDPLLLFKLLRAAMAHDYPRAIGELGVDYALIFAANRNFAAFAPVAWLLLYPTVFDEEAAYNSSALIMAGAAPDSLKPEEEEDDDGTSSTASGSATPTPSPTPPATSPTPTSQRRPSVSLGPGTEQAQRKHQLQQILKKPEVIVEQLRFLRTFTEMTWKLQGGVTDSLIELMGKKEKRPRPFILPFAVNASFLHALLRANYFREFFSFADDLVQQTAGYSTQSIFRAFSAVGAKDFKTFLTEKLNIDPKKPWESDHLVKALRAILFLVKSPSSCPESLSPLFGQALLRISLGLDKALKGLEKTPDPAVELSGKAQAKKKAEYIRDKILKVTADPAVNKSPSFFSVQKELAEVTAAVAKFI